jgi:hypothetical protein
MRLHPNETSVPVILIILSHQNGITGNHVPGGQVYGACLPPPSRAKFWIRRGAMKMDG